MKSLKHEIDQKREEFLKEVSNIGSLTDLNKLRVEYSKKTLKSFYAHLKDVDAESKKALGKIINDYKDYIENAINDLKEKFNSKEDVSEYDVTITKNTIRLGVEHPLIKFYKKIENILIAMGFSVVQGPEIELDKYNFEMLNLPPHHPARDMQDTFYVTHPNLLLRSHTSSVQIRTMLQKKPPIQIISQGTVYRVDAIDPQHTPMFYQMEGLMVSENISFANLKAVLINLIKEVFGESVDVRFRPSYYPYTEPSAAMDISCVACGKKGCRTCGNSGWITVLGSGMVHPNVLEGVGYDPSKYTGFAFGIGLNRLALIYYGLTEIRKFYENDISLWEQL